MERNLLKKTKKRSELIIPALQESGEDHSFKRKPANRNEVQTKPLMSARNRHQLRSVSNFATMDQKTPHFKEITDNKIKVLERLQIEKTQLMKSLQILKQGAVSAILQKEQQIHKLKQHIYISSLSQLKSRQKQQQHRANNHHYQKQLQLKQSYQKQLQEQVQQLRRQLRKQRIRYESELYQKEQIISSLYVQLNESHHKIEEFEKHDIFLNEKLKYVELQNMSLLKEIESSQNLSNSQHAISSQFFFNISNVTNKSTNKSLPCGEALFQQAQLIGDLSYASTVPIKKYSQFSNSQDDHSYSFISQRIQAIRQRHKQQVKQIKQHYQLQINKLKKQYENKDDQRQVHQNRSQQTLKRNGSSESFQSAGYVSKQEFGSKRLNRCKGGGPLSISHMRQYSLQGATFVDNMEAILERREFNEDGTPCNHFSLKHQILEEEMYPTLRNSPNYDTVTTRSNFHNHFNNKNSSQKYLPNFDTISQFTANHFEYPVHNMVLKTDRPFQRTNSVETLQAEDQNDDIKTRKIASVQEKLGSYNFPDKVLSKSSSKELQSPALQKLNFQSDSEQNDKISSKSNHSERSDKRSIKKDIMLFCMGLLTGGTLIGVGKKLLIK